MSLLNILLIIFLISLVKIEKCLLPQGDVTNLLVFVCSHQTKRY